MNKRRKAYLRQLVADKRKVPGLSDEDIRYIVNLINKEEKQQQIINEKKAFKLILETETRGT